MTSSTPILGTDHILDLGRAKGFPKSQRRLEGDGTLMQIKTYHQDRLDILVDSEDVIADILYRDLATAGIEVGKVFLTDTTDSPDLLAEISLDRNQEARLKWAVDLKFQELVEDEVAGVKQGLPPDMLTPEWAWTSENIDKEWFTDAYGFEFASSAGEHFGLTMPIAIPVLTIERFEAFFNPGVIVNFVNRVNSTPFYGVDPGMALCTSIEDRKDTNVLFDGQYYRRVRYQFKFAVPFIEEILEGWADIVIDRGTYYLDSQGNKVHFKAGGSDVAGNLNGSGGKVSFDGEYWLGRFWRYLAADFSVLNLGPF